MNALSIPSTLFTIMICIFSIGNVSSYNNICSAPTIAPTTNLINPNCPTIEAEIIGSAVFTMGGGIASFTVDIVGGVGPYELTLDDGSIVPNYNSGDPVNVNIWQSRVVTLFGVVDANGCTHTLLLGGASMFVLSSNSTQPPVASCQNITIDMDVSGQVIINPSDINYYSDDYDTNINQLSYSLDQNTFDCSYGSSTMVTLTVTDLDNNSDQCTSIVTIDDPLAICCTTIRYVLSTPDNFIHYQADQGIISNAVIEYGTGVTDVIFDAGLFIDLQPGFEVELGASFRTEISPCNAN